MKSNSFHPVATLIAGLSLVQLMCGGPAPVPQTPTASAPAIDIDAATTTLNSLFPAAMQANGVTACSVALVYPDGSGALQKSFFNYGTLAAGPDSPATSDTEYKIGSLSKLFTTDLLASLVLDGKMKLDDPLQMYFPAEVHVPTYQNEVITLRELATHTSGLPRSLKSPQQGAGGAVSAEQPYQFLNNYQLTRAPGSKWEYSNLANAILGLAEERVSSDNYEDLVLTKIAGPLGLKDTRAALTDQEKANLAAGHPLQNGPSAPFADSGEMLAAGGLRSTAADMAIYLAANIDPASTGLQPMLEMTQQQQSTVNVVMGLGWKTAAAGTPKEQFNKAGATPGYNAYIAFSRVARNGFVILCNGNVVSDLAPKVSALTGGSDAAVDPSE